MNKLDQGCSTLFVELSGVCNLNCRICGMSGLPKSVQGLMDSGLFREIISRVIDQKLKVNGLCLFWLGEPLLHPEFSKLLVWASSKDPHCEGFRQLDFHTNGLLFKPEIQEAALEASQKLERITFSLDAFTERTYRRVRPGGDSLAAAVSNIRNFLKLRSLTGSNRPRVNIQMILLPENINEAGRFINYWRNCLESFGSIEPAVNYDWDRPATVEGRDAILIKRCFSNIPSTQKFLEKFHRRYSWPVYQKYCMDYQAGKFKDYPPAEKFLNDSGRHLDLADRVEGLGNFESRSPCPAVEGQLMVRYDGALTVCCADRLCQLFPKFKFPDMSFEKFLSSTEYLKLRQAHLSRDLSEFLKCRECANQATRPLEFEENLTIKR